MRFSLIGLYLLPLIVTVAIRVSGSAYNHHYSTDRQYSSSPGEMCKLTISKPNGEYKEALVNCNLISSIIWDAATKPNDQHVKNTMKVSVNSTGNSLVNSRPEALRLSTFPPILSNTNSAKVRHNFNQYHHILKNGSKPYYMDQHEFASSANLRHKNQHDMTSRSNSNNERQNENKMSSLAGNGNRRLAGWPQAPEFALKNGFKPYYMDLHELASSSNLRHKDQHDTKSASNSDNERQNENKKSLAGNANRRLARRRQAPEYTLKNGSIPYYMDLHELASSASLRHKDQHNTKSGSNSDNEPQTENDKSGLAGNGNRRLAGWPQAPVFTLKNGSKPYYMDLHELASNANLRHKDQHNAKSGSNNDSEPQNKNNSSGLAGNGNRRLVGWPQARQHKFTLRHKDQHNAKSGSNSNNEPLNENNTSGLAGNGNRRLVRWPQTHEFTLKNGSKPYYMDLHEVALKNGIQNYD